jgi:arsenite-transporting ATPase
MSDLKSEFTAKPADGSRILMFGGKGGVGKTTCAAATACHYASLGKKTLAISTDATPSLSHIFEITRAEKPTKVTGALSFSELGIEEVKEMWDRKFGHEVYEVFSSFVAIDYPEFVEFMTSVLPGLGDEFMVDYIRELSLRDEYQNVIWDTAPLGQTLALLKTPALLGQHLWMAPRVYSRLKLGERSREPVLSILRRWQKLSAENMEFLRDRVGFTLVTIAEALAVEQLESIFSELNDYGLKVQQLIINNVVKDDSSEFLRTKARQQRNHLELIYKRYANLRIVELPLFSQEVKGLDRLQEVARVLFE